MSDARSLRRLRSAASLAVAPLLLALVASAPLCELGMEECLLPEPAPMGAMADGSHCPMDAAGLGDMPCCVEEAVPHGPSPAAPGSPDLRVQLDLQALAPAAAAASLEAPRPAAHRPVRPEPPMASPVPLYTLLSTLLN
ncbi:MAG: hypothetical protein ACLF0P_12790 [Thermoanaerobaculia bacterium]